MPADDYTVSSLDELGDGYGFRKVRNELAVSAFGVNAIVVPPGYESDPHYHETQEELYFVHRGTMEMRFGDGSAHTLGPGGLARVAPQTVRSFRNAGDDDLIYVCVGGAGGYVGRDGRRPGDDDEAR